MPLSYMSRIVFSLLLVYSSSLFAKDMPVELVTFTTLQVAHMFDDQRKDSIKDLPDLVDKEDKVDRCIDEYVKTQSKSYSKIVQNDLYDLINNFNNIASRIQGKKKKADEIPFENKIEALAKVQCEAYYSMGVLK